MKIYQCRLAFYWNLCCILLCFYSVYHQDNKDDYEEIKDKVLQTYLLPVVIFRVTCIKLAHSFSFLKDKLIFIVSLYFTFNIIEEGFFFISS